MPFTYVIPKWQTLYGPGRKVPGTGWQRARRKAAKQCHEADREGAVGPLRLHGYTIGEASGSGRSSRPAAMPLATQHGERYAPSHENFFHARGASAVNTGCRWGADRGVPDLSHANEAIRLPDKRRKKIK